MISVNGGCLICSSLDYITKCLTCQEIFNFIFGFAYLQLARNSLYRHSRQMNQCYRRHRYNFRRNCSNQTTAVYSCHLNLLIKIRIRIFVYPFMLGIAPVKSIITSMQPMLMFFCFWFIFTPISFTLSVLLEKF